MNPWEEIEQLVDEDIWSYVHKHNLSRVDAYTIQILREMKEGGPEDKTVPVKGFTN